MFSAEDTSRQSVNSVLDKAFYTENDTSRVQKEKRIMSTTIWFPKAATEFENTLSHDVASESDIMSSNKINKTTSG